jgi:PKD repeat protein
LSDPSFTYPGFGSYTVTLIAQKGTACETSTNINIQVSEITAAFVSVDTICEGTPISFTDASVTQIGTTITDWDWDFGDLNVSSAQNPTHQYNGTSGTVTVTLVVESDIGCVDTATKDIEIIPLPIVDAGLDTAVCIGNPTLAIEWMDCKWRNWFLDWTGRYIYTYEHRFECYIHSFGR